VPASAVSSHSGRTITLHPLRGSQRMQWDQRRDMAGR